MLAGELRGMAEGELDNRLRDLREQAFKLRFQKTTGQVESAATLSKVRREIARVLTIRREREIGRAAAKHSSGHDQAQEAQS